MYTSCPQALVSETCERGGRGLGSGQGFQFSDSLSVNREQRQDWSPWKVVQAENKVI